MMTCNEVENSIMNRVILVNNKAKGPVANIFSPYIVIDIDKDKTLCERGLCQYIYVMRRDNMENIKWLKYNLDRFRLENSLIWISLMSALSSSIAYTIHLAM